MSQPRALKPERPSKYREYMDSCARLYLSTALHMHNYNVSAMSKAIGVHRTHLYKLLHKYGVPVHRVSMLDREYARKVNKGLLKFCGARAV